MFYDTPTHFVGELMGASLVTTGRLREISRRGLSLSDLLGRFPDVEGVPGSINIGGSGNSFEGLTLFADRDFQAFRLRYPELADRSGSGLVYNGDFGKDETYHGLSVEPQVESLWLNDVLTTNSRPGQVRARYFQNLWLIGKNVSLGEMCRQLEERYPQRGQFTRVIRHLPASKERAAQHAANFAALAGVHQVGEVTLSDFLEEQRSLLLGALSGVRLIPQPTLPWLVGGGGDSSIRPDFLVVDSSGHVHVCDLKLPLLNRKSLTTGGHARRRLVSSVMEGVAQLANYREYLEEPAHQRLLQKEYDVSVATPKMTLVVGSSENYDAEQVAEALRALQPVELIDFDSLRAMYLMKTGNVVEGV